MHAIEALMAGVRGAEHGTAKIYRRGTTTRASVYEDFEGTAVDSSGVDIDLDGYGRAEVYVNEVVDVVILNSAGADVLAYVSSGAAGNVEYQGQGFTGSNYESGAVGAGSGYATTLQSILDLARTSFGSTNWRVLNAAGAPITLAVALGGLRGLVYNVKDPQYGATGDGVADDTTAIQAAVTAADDAGGGIVFFPRGDYLLGSVVEVPLGVSLIGAGENSVTIGLTALSGYAFSFQGSSGSSPVKIVAGIHFAATSTTDAVLYAEGGARIAMFGCHVTHTGANGSAVEVEASALTRFAASACRFRIQSATSDADVFSSAGSAQLDFNNCIFETPTAYTPANAIVYGNQLSMRGCRFNLANSTSGTFSCVAFNTTTVIGQISGCQFTNGAGATCTAIDLGTYATGSFFSESDNIFGTTVTAYEYTNGLTADPTGHVELNTRTKRYFRYDHAGAPAALPMKQYGIMSIVSTRAANTVYTEDGAPPHGSETLVLIRNEDASNRQFEIVSAFVSTAGVRIINTNTANAWRGIYVQSSILGTDVPYWADYWSA